MANTGWNIYRATDPEGPFTKVNDEVVTEKEFEDTGLTTGQEYHWEIRRVQYFLEGDPSDTFSLAPVPHFVQDAPAVAEATALDATFAPGAPTSFAQDAPAAATATANDATFSLGSALTFSQDAVAVAEATARDGAFSISLIFSQDAPAVAEATARDATFTLGSALTFSQDAVAVAEATARDATFALPAGRPSTGSEYLVLEASDITGLSDGDEVVTWSDASGNGRNAVSNQGVGANVVYKTGIFGSKPSVRTQGGDRLVAAFGATLTAPFTVFLVMKSNDGATTSSRYFYHLYPTTPAPSEFRRSTNIFLNNTVVDADETLLNTASVVQIDYTTGNEVVTIDGVEKLNAAVTNPSVTTLSIGATSTGSSPSSTDYALMVILASPATQDKTDWLSYIASEYP